MKSYSLSDAQEQLSNISMQASVLAGMYASLGRADRRALIAYLMTETGHVESLFKGLAGMLEVGFGSPSEKD